MNGKNKCKILKEIRRRIAEKNDIAYVTSECKHQGNCLGTCPKCEAEVRYLEEQLAARKRAGYAVALTGLALTLTAATASCTPETVPPKTETTSVEETTVPQDTTISSETTEWIELGGVDIPPETDMGEVAVPIFEELLTYSTEERNNYISMYTRDAIRAEWGNDLVSEDTLWDSFEILCDDSVCLVTVFYTAQGLAKSVSIDETVEPMGDPVILETDSTAPTETVETE